MSAVAAPEEETFDGAPSDGEGRVLEVGEEGWGFETDEGVLREKEAGLQRTERAKAHIEAQSNVLRNIHAKMAEGGEDEGDRSMTPGQVAPGSAPGSNWGSASHLGSREIGSPEQQKNALIVSDKMVHRQDRIADFSRRRRSELERDRQFREQLSTELDAASLRSASRQREIFEKQRHRAFAQDQKRSEQQKTLRELDREKDLIWEAYYDKRSSQSPERSRGSPRSVSTAPHSTSNTIIGATNEDIFRCTLRSHKMYSTTLEGYQEFVKENEKRTEAYWKKMLLGNTKFREELTGVGRKTTITGKSKGGSRMSAGPTMNSSQMTFSTEEGTRRNRSQLISDSFMSGTSTGPLSPLNSSNWEARMAKCNQYMEHLDKKDTIKLQKKFEDLKQHRDRINGHNKGKVDRAVKRGEVWQERNDTATARRLQLEIKTDDDMVAKRAAYEERRSEEMARQFRFLAEKARTKNNTIQDVQANCKLQLDTREEQSKTRWQEKDAMTNDMYTQRLDEYGRRLDGGAFEETVQAVLAKKKELERDVVRKAKEEIAAKEKRSHGAKEQLSQPALVKERSMRKARSASGVITSPSRLGSSSLYSSLTPEPSPLGQDPNFSVSAVTLPALSATGGLSVAATEAPSPRTPGGEARRGTSRPSSGSRRSSVAQNADLEDEGVFLQELESRSVSWLQDLRRKKRNNIGSPY